MIIYTCPMHPDVQQDLPDDCHECNRGVELKMGPARTEDNKADEHAI